MSAKNRPSATTRPSALVPIADGSEEIEAVGIIDTLRRAEVEVTVAAVGPERTVTCSRGVVLTADALIDAVAGTSFDLVALPGGMPGAQHLHESVVLGDLLRAHHAREGLIGAICAAPAVVLLPLGILDGRAATGHPAFFDRLDPDRRREDRVVRDGHLITSRGPGTALEFALALVGALRGEERRQAVAGPMLTRD
jgi:4-methyl-5(b-hydroxyethyl)-thiazole monophosphate biosynthesis